MLKALSNSILRRFVRCNHMCLQNKLIEKNRSFQNPFIVLNNTFASFERIPKILALNNLSNIPGSKKKVNFSLLFKNIFV